MPNGLDEKEEKIFADLKERWEKFTAPGVIEKGLQKITKKVDRLVPKKIQEKLAEYVEKAMSAKIVQKVLIISSKGFFGLGKNLARHTLSKHRIEKAINKRTGKNCTFNSLVEFRSYDLEKGVVDNKIRKQVTAFIEGGATGFFGFAGIPFNIAFSLLMYYRTVQYVALCYGFDVLEDPREMEIASEVLINCMNPNIDTVSAGVGAFMARSMFYAEMTSLSASLIGKKTFEEMAKKGGAQLFYTQIRALANKAAQKGLEKAGKKGIENVFLRKILENIGKKLPKQFAGKAIPFLGAVVGAGFDLFYMNRVIDGANLQYHKRFLIEKSERNKGTTE